MEENKIHEDTAAWVAAWVSSKSRSPAGMLGLGGGSRAEAEAGATTALSQLSRELVKNLCDITWMYLEICLKGSFS